MKTALQPWADYPRLCIHAAYKQIIKKYPEVGNWFSFGFVRDDEEWLRSTYHFALHKKDHEVTRSHPDISYEDFLASDYEPNWWRWQDTWRFSPHKRYLDNRPEHWVDGCRFVGKIGRAHV